MLPQGFWSRKQNTPGGDLVSKQAKLRGNMHATAGGGFHGTLEGDITVEGLLTVGETGCITGDVKATGCRVAGNIIGPVSSEGETSLEKASHVRGDIRASALRIEKGANFQGRILLGK